MIRNPATLAVTIGVVLCAMLHTAAAQDASQPRPLAPSEPVTAFFKTYCTDCHGPETQEGKLRLDTLAADFDDNRTAAAWIEVMDRLNLSEMPPQDERQPGGDDVIVVTDWVRAQLDTIQRRAESTGGRALLRRLSRSEYANTVRDLLHVSFHAGEGPLDVLPPDGSIKGFNKASKGLLLDPSLMEAYFKVAELIAHRAVATRPAAATTHVSRFELEDTAHHLPIQYIVQQRSAYVTDSALVVMEAGARTFDKLKHPYNRQQIPVNGAYIIRVKAGADPGRRGEPVYMDVTRGSDGRLARFRVDAPLDKPEIYEFTRVYDASVSGEIGVSLVNGTKFHDHNYLGHEFNQKSDELLQSGNKNESVRLRARARAEGLFDIYPRTVLSESAKDLDALPKLALDYIEVEGPLNAQWPPLSRTTIFFDGVDQQKQTLDDARQIFGRLLPRAYRRPVTSIELDEIVDLVGDELAHGESFESAVEVGLVGMLCSPNFLYLFEPSGAAGDGGAAADKRQLSGFELATRLSYFLWSSKPDDELFLAAKSGKLHERPVLDAQIDRLLADPRAESLVDDFARQWLKVDEFGRFQPDQQIFPDYYSNENTDIGRDIAAEPLAVFREVLTKHESVLTFLDSDWTMLNDRLARYYAIDGVEGNEFRRVALPADSARGGLLGMAGVHMWGSDGARTKPVERGKYILDVLFNDPPPPPPPNAGEVEPNIRGENLTVRERLAKHRHVPTCANCHRRIDPYGLALENFNVIGQWRDLQDGEKPLAHWGDKRAAIDAAGAMPSGREFADFAEFKVAMREQSDRFLRGLSEKMFLYAVGRTLEPSDRVVIDQCVAAMKSDNHSLRSLIKTIANSEPFQTK